MLTSAEQLFSDAQAITTTAASTNYIDLGATGTVLGAPAALVRDIAKGKPIPVYVRHLVAAGGTSPTISVAVEVDDNSSFSSATVVSTSETVSGATAGQEQWIDVHLPEGTNERYLRLNYTTGGTSPTHTVEAGIAASRPSNYTVPGA
jgi:hypothetical protein